MLNNAPVSLKIEPTPEQWRRAEEYFKAYTHVAPDDVPDKFKAYVIPAKEIVKREGRLVMKYTAVKAASHPKDGVLLENGQRFRGKLIATAYREASEIVLFAASMINIQDILNRHDEMMETFFIEYWAVSLLSVCREHLVKILDAQLKAQDLKQTGVWSPGQSGFTLENQIPLFSLLKPETVGITLDHHQRMLPLKSISGTIGLVPQATEITMFPCDYCEHAITCPGYSGKRLQNENCNRRLT